MAYCSKEDIDSKRKLFKELNAKYNIKATLAGTNTSTMKLNISAGSIDFFESLANVKRSKYSLRESNEETIQELKSRGYLDVNPYWYQEHYDGIALEYLNEAIKIMKIDWYDLSDAMTDYFNCAWYIRIYIGKWNKPYQFVQKA